MYNQKDFVIKAWKSGKFEKANLTDMERDVLIKFFGLKKKSSSLSDIGKVYGLTREKVRQIKERGISKLNSI